MPANRSPSAVLTPGLALLYAAGDVGPSLTSLCIAFYWLYFLIEVAGIPVVEAGAIHASGYVVSAFANIWAGHYLDRQQQSAARRAVFVASLGVTMSLCFVLLWLVAFSGAGRALWYLLLFWLFHLLFSIVYLSYLSLTTLLSANDKDRVTLNGYRFGGTMLLTVILLGLHGQTAGIWSMQQRLLALGLAVGLCAALGSLFCGLGLGRALCAASTPADDGRQMLWRQLVHSSDLWSAVGSNLAVWFTVQMTLVLTIFLCAAAGVSDANVLLTMQLCIIVAAASSVAVRRWPARRLLEASALIWCVGAALWSRLNSPFAAAALLGVGLGAGTVLTWAQVPAALARLTATGSGRAEARAYAGLTVLRDLISALVPMLVALAMNGRVMGSVDAGHVAAGVLIVASIGSAVLLTAFQAFRSPPVAAADGEKGPIQM